MKYTNLLEKLIGLFTIAGKSWINLGFLLFFIVILVLICMKKLSKKKGFILSLIGDIALIVYTINTYETEVNKLIGNITDHLFTDIYFPSIYVYLFVFLFINIVTIGNLLNIHKKGIYQTIHGICFLVSNFILALILDIVSKNKIDVFSKSSLFSNTDLIILLELSVSIFIIWLVSLGVIYLTNVISERIFLYREQTNLAKKATLVTTNSLEVKNTSIEEPLNPGLMNENSFVPQMIIEDSSHKNQFIPTFETETNKQLMIEKKLSEQMNTKEENMPMFIPIQNQETIISELPKQLEEDYVSTITSETKEPVVSFEENNQFDLSAFIPKKQENHIIQPMDTSTIFEQILNNQLPLKKEEEVTSNSYEEEKNTYTLNDYRVFHKMLKDIKEHNQSNTIQIDKMLEYRLITKYSSETYDLFKRMLKNYSN